MKYQKLPDATQYRLNIINMMAKVDGTYVDMLKTCALLEMKYEDVLKVLSTEQMDIICDFLTHCEAMSDRLLELACTYMRFPE